MLSVKVQSKLTLFIELTRYLPNGECWDSCEVNIYIMCVFFYTIYHPKIVTHMAWNMSYFLGTLPVNDVSVEQKPC
jgi:hypothetical protein